MKRIKKSLEISQIMERIYKDTLYTNVKLLKYSEVHVIEGICIFKIIREIRCGFDGFWNMNKMNLHKHGVESTTAGHNM